MKLSEEVSVSFLKTSMVYHNIRWRMGRAFQLLIQSKGKLGEGKTLSRVAV